MKRDANGNVVPMLIAANWDSPARPIPDLLRAMNARATELMGMPVSFVIPSPRLSPDLVRRVLGGGGG